METYKRLAGLKHLSSLRHYHKAEVQGCAPTLLPIVNRGGHTGSIMRRVSSSQPGRYIMTDRSPNLAKGINLQIQAGVNLKQHRLNELHINIKL